MAEYLYQTITDFSPGLNREYDPRVLRPATVEDTVAEATRCENYDIIQKGAIYTAPGYEEVLQLGTGQPIDAIAELDYSPYVKYKVVVSDDDLFHLRKMDELVMHDMDRYDSPTYGTWTQSDAGNGLNTYPLAVRGVGSVTANINSTLSANEYMTLECTIPSVDLTGYEYVENFVKIVNRNDSAVLPSLPSDVFDDVTIRVGTDNANYYEWTHTSNALNESFPEDRWSGMRSDLSSPGSTVGAPDITDIKYLSIVFNYTLGSFDYSSGVYVDQFQAVKESSTYNSIDITGSNWGAAAQQDQKIVQWVQYTGSQGYPYLIFANNDQVPLKAYNLGEGMMIAEQISGLSSFPVAVATMTGYLFWAHKRTVTYSAPEDEDDYSTLNGGGVFSFDADIRGLAPTVDNKLLVGLERDIKAITFLEDATNYLWIPSKDNYTAGVGILSAPSISPKYNDSIFLGTDGVAYFGQDETLASDNYVVNSLSWRIDKLLQDTNLDAIAGAVGFTNYRKKEYGLAVPVGRGVQTNNQMFVYKWQYNAWIRRTGISVACATEVSEDEKTEVWFGTPYDDVIYKFNETHNYNGDSYVRRYAFKTFTFGAPGTYKRVPHIEVAGSMPFGSEFYVVVRSDGIEKTFKVTDSAILQTSTGGWIGDDWYGKEYYGGIEVSSSPYDFYRFHQRIPLPDSIVEGREYEVEFYYEGTASPHKIDYLGIKYTYLPETKIPDAQINNNLVPNVIP